MRKLAFGIVLCLLAAIESSAAPGGAVRCGKLLDVRTGQMLTDQVVTFDESGVISSVAPATGAATSSIDLSKATCLPGLIDVHTHITANPTDAGYAGL